MLHFRDLRFHQLLDYESNTYTYVLADPKSLAALIIDPVIENFQRDFDLLEASNYKLLYILDTHVHADHITGAAKLREKTGAKTVISAGAKVACVDISLNDGDKLKVGDLEIVGRQTPGHTDSCMSYMIPGAVFTGDTLLVRGCGRTDFQQGSSERLWKSVRDVLFALPDETIVFPAHDYKGFCPSTIGLEKKWNPRLGLHKTREEFYKIMSELKLDQPKKIQVAVPANLLCGQAS